LRGTDRVANQRMIDSSPVSQYPINLSLPARRSIRQCCVSSSYRRRCWVRPHLRRRSRSDGVRVLLRALDRRSVENRRYRDVDDLGCGGLRSDGGIRLAGKEFGQLILAACFFTDLGTVVALGLLFANYNLWLVALAVAIVASMVWFQNSCRSSSRAPGGT